MFRTLTLLGCFVLSAQTVLAEVFVFKRGDADRNGAFDLTDAVVTLRALFVGEPSLQCEDAADSNDDGRLTISDPVVSLNYLFGGTTAIPTPGPETCGVDLTPDALGCGEYRECAQDLYPAVARLPMHSRATDFVYEIVDGQTTFQGDVVLGSADEIVRAPPPRQIRTRGNLQEDTEGGLIDSPEPVTDPLVARAPQYFWAGGIIPYDIRPGDFSDEQVGRIKQTIEELNAKTNLELTPWLGESDYVLFVRGPDDLGGLSYVGRVGGRQSIKLHREAPVGTVLHEILHSAGMWHEQSRPDRDAHVTVLEQNIARYPSAFKIHLEQAMLLTDYDVDSIMHYGGFAFSRTDDSGLPLPTIIDKATGEPVVRRNVLSDLDIEGINRLYSDSAGGKANIFVGEESNRTLEVWAWNKSLDAFLPRDIVESRNYDKSDILLTGNIYGDAKEELIVVEDDGGKVEVLGYTFEHGPVPIHSELWAFRLGFDVIPATIGVGDVLGGPEDELIADRGRTSEVWGVEGGDFTLLHTFATTRDRGDTLVVGNILGGPKDDVVVLEDSGGKVELFSWRNDHFVRTPSAGFLTVDSYGGRQNQVVVGDVDGDSVDELLVLVPRSGATLRVDVWKYRSSRFERAYSFESRGSAAGVLAVGDVMRDDKAEVLVARRNKRIEVWGLQRGRFTQLTDVIRARFDGGDALTVGLRGHRPCVGCEGR